MHNQDDVARHLIRVPIDEMHLRMIEYGTTGWCTRIGWHKITKDSRTVDFLRSHGWLLDEYVAQCKSTVHVDGRIGGMSRIFARYYE